MFARYVTPELKRLGFRRRGRVYRLGGRGANQVVIWIQGSTGSGPMGYIFYVWCGVLPHAMEAYRRRHDSVGGTVLPDPPVDRALFATRILAPEEVAFSLAKVGQIDTTGPIRRQWFFSDPESERACGQALVSAVTGHMPLFERLLDSRRILELYELRREATRPFIVRGHANAALRAMLLADYGASTELMAAIDELKQEGLMEVVDWVQSRMNQSE